MNIMIAGDFFVSDAFKSKDLICKSVIDEFKDVDLRLINQESPITQDLKENKIAKTGPHLQSEPGTVIPYLHKLNVDVVTLANNHILDYGSPGLKDTFSSLSEEKIDYIGAGKNFEEASQAYSCIKNDVKVAILNFAENEWSTTFGAKPGASPLDIIENVKQIKKAKKNHDKVVCIIHGGHEYYSLPSPRMRKQYRFYVDNGADAIVGHHTHCISGYEVYKGSPIIYSLGNFLFTKPSDSDLWYQGLLVKLFINKDDIINFELLPIEQQKGTYKVALVTDKRKKDEIIKGVNELSEIIKDDLELQIQWDRFVWSKKEKYQSFLSPLSGLSGRYLRALVYRLRLAKIISNQRQRLLMANLIRCEAHRDLMQASLSSEYEK